MKKKQIKKIQQSPIFNLGFGTVLSHAIPLLIQPIITRLITPSEMGIYSVIISLANLIIPISSLKLYQLIVTSNSDEKSEELLQASFNLTFLISLIYLVIIGLFYILKIDLIYNLGLQAFLIPFIVFTNGCYFILISYFNRYKSYSKIALSDIGRESLKSLVQIILAFFNLGSVSQTMGNLLGPLGVLYYSFKYNNFMMFSNSWLGFKETWIKVYKNKSHVLFSVPAQLLNTFSSTIILLSITSLYSATQAGYYSISLKLLGIPLVLISNNISKVYLQKFSELYRRGSDFKKFYLKILIYLSIGSILIFTFLAILAPTFVPIIFGETYAKAGLYISVLSPLYMTRIVASSIIGTYIIFHKQYIEFAFQILFNLFGILAFIISSYMSINPLQYLGVISLTYSIVYILIILNITFLVLKKEYKYNE